MDDQTLTALRASITHWDAMAQGDKRHEPHGNECALCILFNNETSKPMCEGCPVKEKTGCRGCYGTPYMPAWSEYTRNGHSEMFRVNAKAEADFLRTLLPENNNA